MSAELVNDNQKKILTLELDINEVNVVMTALQELPHRIVDPVIRKIVEQAQSQLNQS